MNRQRDTIAAPFARDRIMSTRGDLSMLPVRAAEDDFNQRTRASKVNEMYQVQM